MAKKAPQTRTPQTDEHDHADGHVHPHDNVIQPNSKIIVTIPWAEVQPVFARVLQKAAQHLKADGFRIGKVPPQVAEKLLKKDVLYEEVIQQVLPAAYNKALQAAKKLPISRPEIDPIQLEKEKDWIFDIYFAEQQPIILGKYQEIAKKAIKDAQKEIVQFAGDLKKKPEAPSKDEKPATKPAATQLTAPQKEDIQLKHIFKNLVEKIQPKVQEILIRAEVNREIQKLIDQLGQLNLKVEDYLRSRKVTGEQLQQEYAATAVTSLQIEFILAEIAHEQKLTVTDQEIDATLDKVGDGKMSLKQRQDGDYRSYVFSNLLKQKVVQHLLSL